MRSENYSGHSGSADGAARPEKAELGQRLWLERGERREVVGPEPHCRTDKESLSLSETEIHYQQFSFNKARPSRTF